MTLYDQPAATMSASLAQRRRRWDRVDMQPRGTVHPYTQGALALTYSLPSGLEAEPVSAALTVVGAGTQSPGALQVPDPEAWAARFLQAVVEVVSSDRPLTQLVRWTDPHVYGEISRQRRTPPTARPGPPTRTERHQVASIHVCRPSVLVAEVAARVSAGQRSRAMAARLDFQRERWLCTALVFG